AVVLGHGEAVKHTDAGRIDLTSSAGAQSGAAAFAEAGVTPADIQYASIYDSFTITVLMALEDLGFCERGRGGAFVEDGGLRSPDGRLPFNTDGGGLCSNHPGNRGGMTKVIEAVRRRRGWRDPGDRGGAPWAGPAPPGGAGAGLRAGAGPRPRRRAVHPPRQRHPRAGSVGGVTGLPAPLPPYNPEAAPFWAGLAEGR